ncbi:MAG: hypothetical protein ACLUE8_05260 [Lachnospiraceae bacterium]
MKEKKLRRLGRADLVEILYRQRELIDQLDEQNRRLQERAEKAEAQARSTPSSGRRNRNAPQPTRRFDEICGGLSRSWRK